MHLVRRGLAVSLLLLLVGHSATAAGIRPRPGPQQPLYSRARWIGANMHRWPFSGGVVPDLAPAPLRPAAAGAANDDSILVDPGLTAPVRVNNDLLGAGGGTNPESQAEPDIAVNPFRHSNVVAVYQESRFRDGGARALNFATSKNGGATWVEGSLPGLTLETGGPWQRASDPWVAFGPGGRAYFASLDFNETTPENQIGVSVSTDGGLSFGPPVTVFRSPLDFNDKEAIEVDTHTASPFFGNVYVAWDINIAAGPKVGAQHLVVARSTNGGASYRTPTVLRTAGVNIGAIPRIGPDGTVYVVWGGTAPGSAAFSVYFAKSTNGGATYTVPRAIHSMNQRGVPFIRDGSILPSFAVDRASGDLYVVWADSRWSGVDQSTISFSRDGGATWSAPARVSDGPADAPTFTAAVAVNGKGEVGVSYTSLENDPQRRFLVDQYLSISRDRGLTFESRRRVSPATGDVRFAAWARDYFLGDYTGIAGAGGKFHLLWVFPMLPAATTMPPPLPGAPGFDLPMGGSGPSAGFSFRLQSDVFASRTR